MHDVSSLASDKEKGACIELETGLDNEVWRYFHNLDFEDLQEDHNSYSIINMICNNNLGDHFVVHAFHRRYCAGHRE